MYYALSSENTRVILINKLVILDLPKQSTMLEICNFLPSFYNRESGTSGNLFGISPMYVLVYMVVIHLFSMLKGTN